MIADQICGCGPSKRSWFFVVLFEVIADGLFKLAVDAKGSSSDLPVGSKK